MAPSSGSKPPKQHHNNPDPPAPANPDPKPSAPAVDPIDEIHDLKVQAAQTRLKVMRREARAERNAPPPVDPVDEIHDMKIRAAKDRLRAERSDDAPRLDKKYTNKDKTQFQKDQARLERREQRIRDRLKNQETRTEEQQPDLPRNRFLAEEQSEISHDNRESVRERIRNMRERYFENHDVWVDANGKVYSASVSETGRIVGRREDSVPADGDNPGLMITQEVSIGVWNFRRDMVLTETEPGEEGEVSEKRKEVLWTGPKGHTLRSWIAERQERVSKDGTIERSHTREDYDKFGRATTLKQNRATIGSDGTIDRKKFTTYFREDGVTADHTVDFTSTTTGEGDERQTTSDELTTYLRADGVTPRHTILVNEGLDANGNEPLTTISTTDFNGAGQPLKTFIRRESAEGELPENTSWREYITWKKNGQPDTIAYGQEGVTEAEFAKNATTGKKPYYVEVDQGDIDTLKDRIAENQKIIENARYINPSTGAVSYSYDVSEYQDQLTTDSADLTQMLEDQERSEGKLIEDIEPGSYVGGTDATTFTRGSDDRWESESLGANLVEPLIPASDTPSVFEVPAMLKAHSNAAALDRSKFATSPSAYAQLAQEQTAFQQQFDGAKTDAQRERLMSDYFSNHDFWIEAGPQDGGKPTLMASGWSEGAPYSSDVFGASRAMDPHAVLARTGIQGQDEANNPAIVDVMRNLYTDGTVDEYTHTSYKGKAGASRDSVTGEHFTINGDLTERDRHIESMVPRTSEGKQPLAVTEVSSERFNAKTGKHDGLQYAAVATSDNQMTTLEEQRDVYGADGILEDRKIESTQMSRNYNEEVTNDFLDANAAALEAARGGKDDFNPNDDEHESITLPPAGSSYVHSLTDIDYDDDGTAIHQQVDEDSILVQKAGDHGVQVIVSDTTRELGDVDGTTAIFDKKGRPKVDETAKTSITTSEFDPEAGIAGGHKSEGHQYRQITEVTLGATVKPDGTTEDEWATPLTTKTLNEGFDDDWTYHEKYLKTKVDEGMQFDVVVDDDEMPVELTGPRTVSGRGYSEHVPGAMIYNEDGELVELKSDGIETGDQDALDHFEDFMAGWGGKIIAGAAVVAGIAGAAFTGGTSLLLLGVAAGLGATSTAATAINYSQGEASGFDLALSIGGTLSFGAGALLARGAKVAAAGTSLARTSSTARVALTGIDDAASAATRGGASRGVALRAVTTSEATFDGYDAWEATRAALRGDFYGAGLMLLAVGGGVAVTRGRRGGGTSDDAGSVPELDSVVQPRELPAGATTPELRPGASPRELSGNHTPELTGANAAPDIPSNMTPDFLREHGSRNDRATMKDGSVRNITKGEPGFHYSEIDGEVVGYSHIGRNGQATMTAARNPDGTWTVRRPTDGTWNPRTIETTRATDLEIPGDVDFQRIYRREADLQTDQLSPNDLAHVTRRHGQGFRNFLNATGNRNLQQIQPAHLRFPEPVNTGNAGLFNADIDAPTLQRLTRKALKNGEWSRLQGKKFEVTWDAGRIVGVDRNGNPTSMVTVRVAKGRPTTIFPTMSTRPSSIPDSWTRQLGNPSDVDRSSVQHLIGEQRPAELGSLNVEDSNTVRAAVRAALAGRTPVLVMNRRDIPTDGTLGNVFAGRSSWDGRSGEYMAERAAAERTLGTNPDGTTQYLSLYFSDRLQTPDGGSVLNMGQSAYGPHAFVVSPEATPRVLYNSTMTVGDSFYVNPNNPHERPATAENFVDLVGNEIATDLGSIEGMTPREIEQHVENYLTSVERNRRYFEMQYRPGDLTLDDIGEIRTTPLGERPTMELRPGTHAWYDNRIAARHALEARGIEFTESEIYWDFDSYGGLEHPSTEPDAHEGAFATDNDPVSDDNWITDDDWITDANWITPEDAGIGAAESSTRIGAELALRPSVVSTTPPIATAGSRALPPGREIPASEMIVPGEVLSSRIEYLTSWHDRLRKAVWTTLLDHRENSVRFRSPWNLAGTGLSIDAELDRERVEMLSQLEQLHRELESLSRAGFTAVSE